ncbi:MAG: DMT family transporter [Burkholderiaceae bacterium]
MVVQISANLRSKTLAGICLLVVATVLVAVQDALTKELTSALPVSQILAVRFAAMTVFAVAYLMVVTGAPRIRVALRSRAPVKQVLRCLLACLEIALFTFALRYLGLAEIHAIFACFPLIVTALSGPMLGETVGWRRWCAVGFGFVGTLLVINPGSGVFEPAALLGLGCALLYALYNLMTRQLSENDSFATSMLYLALTGLLSSLVFAAFQWQPIVSEDRWLLLGVCVTSVASHLLLIKALSLALAVVLQPFNYLILVWASLIAFVVYGELLNSVQLGGVTLVVVSGIYIAWREYVRSATGTS